MMSVVLITFLLLSILADIYIYRNFIRQRKHSKTYSILYIGAAVIAYLALAMSIVVIRNMTFDMSHTAFVTGMWLMWTFFLVITPKYLFAFFSLPDIFISRAKKGRFRPFTYIGMALAAISIVLMVDGATIGRTTIRVERVEVEYGNLPESFDGLRVVQFSDVHLGTMINSEKLLRRMVDSINSLDADIVIQSGDLVNIHHLELTQNIKEILSEIKSRHGVFAVYGNHDLGFYVKNGIDYQENIDAVKEFQQEMGWTFLSNKSEYLNNGVDSILISGLNYPEGMSHNGFNSNMGGIDFAATYESAPDSIFNITISHTPKLWADITGQGRGDLVLAGHVHSMQFKVSIGKWSWSPARFMYKEWSGLYGDGDNFLYINDGIGCVMYPMRVGDSRPEVTLLELRSKR